jgi:hypothetical protein
MSVSIFGTLTIGWVPDGSAGEFVPSAQSLTVVVAPQILAGGNSPTTSQVSTGCTLVATLAAAQFNTTTNSAIIDGWASGNP